MEYLFFPEAQQRVPVYSWGSGGWTCVRLAFLVSRELSSTCRQNSVPIGKVAKGVTHMPPLVSLAFLWRRRVYGGSCKTSCKTSLRRCQSVKIGGGLARNARFKAPTCLLLSLWFSSGFAVSMGEATKRVVFEGVNVSKLEEVDHEMLVLRLPRVSS